MHLVTGYKGEEHIMSADQGSFNASFFGTGQYVMESGSQMEATIIDNNTVRVYDGDLLMYGRHARIEPNTYEDLTIKTGTAGVNRYDLICATYIKNANDGTEDAYFEVIRGTENERVPDLPEYTDGNILEGATFNQMPLYKVVIEGVVLKEVVPMFDTIPTFQALAERYAQEFQKSCESHLDSLNVYDTLEEVEANTQENQLAGALAVKELSQKVNDIDLSASKVNYDNTSSGLNATTAQGAIDELNSSLIADNGTNFKFGYNSNTEEYGYIVTDSEGADTFYPFSNAQKLYEALQYSGLVTEDMTFDEMCNALMNYFPMNINLLGNLTYTVSGGGRVSANTNNSLILTYSASSDHTTNIFLSDNFKIPPSAKYLNFTASVRRDGAGSTYGNKLLLNNLTKGTTTTLYSIEEGTFTINQKYNISAHAGCECSLRWEVNSWAQSFNCVNATVLSISG